jgi:hypothetical protein
LDKGEIKLNTLAEAIVKKSAEAIAKFNEDINCKIRALGIDFDVGNECLMFCFDTEEQHEAEKEYLKDNLSSWYGYVEGETPLEHIGYWAHQALDGEEYSLYSEGLVDGVIVEEQKEGEDDRAYFERKSEAIRDSIEDALKAISQNDDFAKLRKSSDFFLAYQEHDDSFISIVKLD